ncbi:MAG: S9 family peptidase [Gemmatimonadetes bacterium]|uniref:S9 family peptidase n=1 Tax=Candidatus Kutchimonas denitrificans TaxID=3056748 RepID=A0AAE4Z4W1_9BACT|nr:S9 family peptidase [Gemmatimonadota bacterium]NIR73820.1 S9 family peptidase [Candidatus Kutchimonas denitrificans]NIS00093.1 S9 family peptidase [Gemmatimonadota bacterium]NIT65682.1 S9 family peptidase [Gemmatimonadota bacterium]NIU53130.1 prolyl oligopeptidase family serine peptidase [Gemmatimonadota bacterium]
MKRKPMTRIHPSSVLASLLIVGLPVAGPRPATAQGDQEAASAVRALGPRDVARVQSVGEVAIHPDGSTIAYTRNVPREPGRDEDGPAWSRLHVVAFDGSGDRVFVGGEVDVSHVRWSPDGRFLSFLARRSDDEHTSIYLIPARSGESYRLYQHETSVLAFDWRPDSRAIAFVAREVVPERVTELRARGFDQEIYEEDWVSRRLYVLELPGGPEGPPGGLRRIDVPGQPWHVVWGPNGRRLLTDLSPTPLIDDRYMFRRLHVLDANSGAVVSAIENPGKLGPFGFAPDGRSVVLISAADINDPREGRLMVVPTEGGTLRDLMPDLEGHVEAFAFTERDRIVYLASLGVGTRIARIRTDGREDGVYYQGTDPVFTNLSMSAESDRAALNGQAPTHPSEAFALRLESDAEPNRLTVSNPWLADVALADQRMVSWTAADGLEIQGLLIEPLQRAAGERVPTLVVVHGGPESHRDNGWLTSYAQPGQVAAGRGYAVLYPNYRGSTGRGVAFAKADQGDGMGAEFDDILAGIDYLIERGITDPDRVGITGGSYGGYATAWGATRHSERFAAGVMRVGVSDQLSKTGTSDIPRELELVHWLTNPYENPDLFLERSPVMYTENANTPLLILHGKEDPRVNPGQSLELYRALQMTTDVPVRLVLYPGEGHGNRRAASRYDYSLRMLRWFDWFLKEGKEELPPYEIDYGRDDEVS